MESVLLDQPSLGVRKSYLQERVTDFCNENCGLIYVNPQKTYIYIGVKKGMLTEKDFTNRVNNFFQTTEGLNFKNKNNKLGVVIPFASIIVSDDFLSDYSRNKFREPFKSHVEKSGEKSNFDEKQVVIKKFANLGLSLTISYGQFVPNFEFQKHLFLLAQEQKFLVDTVSFKGQVISDILKRESFLDDLFLAKSLLDLTGISFKSFEEDICTAKEDSRYKNGRSYPILFSSQAKYQKAYSFLKDFFLIDHCDENRLFLVNRSSGASSFTKEEGESIFNTQKNKNDMEINNKVLSNLDLNKKLRDLGVYASPQQKGDVYYTSSPKNQSIAVSNATTDLMKTIEKEFLEHFSDHFLFRFTPKSIKYTFIDKMNSNSVQLKKSSNPEDSKSASRVVYKSIVDLLSLLDDFEKKELVSVLGVKTELSKDEIVQIAKKRGLLVIEGGKVLS